MFFSAKLKKFKKIKHCFFSRKGGYSKGIYRSLNCGMGSNDKRENILKNLELVSKKIGCKKESLITLNQKHTSDVIYFKNNRINLIKRVVGVKNEIIEVSKGKLIINEKVVKEEFIENNYYYNFPKTILKKDEVFVLGDNREFSKDSRKFGAIKIKNILSFYRV